MENDKKERGKRMTCIRLDNGQTLHSYCKENNLPYMIMWLRIEKGKDDVFIARQIGQI